MKIPSPYRSYPPRWETFTAFAQQPGPGYFGFTGSIADVNRFAARYRAAKCFRVVDFDELTSATADGYGALVQLLLTYSAFEHFLRCINQNIKSSHSLLSPAERDKALENLRRLGGQREFFRALRQHLDPPYKKRVDSHLIGAACNPIYLAAGIRHAFAHGKLIANVQGVPDTAVATSSRFLCRVLFKIMDREFEKRVAAFEAQLTFEA